MWIKSLLRRMAPGPVRRAVQRWRLNRVMTGHTVRTVRHRYGDVELDIELADPLAAGWYDHDWATPAEVGLLRRSRLRPGAVVFDIGAHQGVVALMLGREVGPAGKIVAVEALPHNAAAAVRNRDLNRMPWVEVVPAGVAARDGTLTICRALNAQTALAGDYAGTVEVPALTIDTLAARYGTPDVVFIDVEGMELDAIRGGPNALAAGPDVFVEVHVGCGLEAVGGTADAVRACFPAEEYEVFVHSETADTPVPIETAPPPLFAARHFLTALSRRGPARP